MKENKPQKYMIVKEMVEVDNIIENELGEQVVSVTIEWGAADAANTITSTNGILEVLN